MTTKKTDNEVDPDAAPAAEPGVPIVVQPFTGRPPDVAPPNSTFAQRAKATGGNKRVSEAEKK